MAVSLSSNELVVVLGFVAALTVRLDRAWTVACLVSTFRRLIVVARTSAASGSGISSTLFPVDPGIHAAE